MNSRDLMKDSYYAMIILGIESLIHEHDRESGGKFSDSDAKSSIRKTLSILKGKQPVSAPTNERERLKEALAIALVDDFRSQQEIAGLPRSDYMRALLATEKSLKTRRDIHGHSRRYLDFLGEFLIQARRQ